MQITIDTTVKAPIDKVWTAWTSPEAIQKWNYAVDDWCCSAAKLELKEGGKFSYRMEARDGSMGFDFEGTFSEVKEHRKIAFYLEDERGVVVSFEEKDDGTKVVETFDAEDENTGEQQRQGWQSILNNFRGYVESLDN